jgi:hypothetical protein
LVLGYAELANGRGGTNVEAIVYTKEMGFDKERSLAAFEKTVYPLLDAYCSGCHSSERTSASAAQAPVHSDKDPKLAHEYALTRVNFREPESSRLVVRLGIERHNCFRDSCEASAAAMLDAITKWSNAVADMIPEVPRGVAADTKITDEQVLKWIEADKAKVPEADREFVKYASFQQLHNAGVSAQNLNHARIGLSKALNSTARWAPRIVNPVDVNGKGIVYRLDIRDYWGYTLIDTSAPDFALFYGGSDDDLAFAKSKIDLSGNEIKYASLATMIHTLKPEITPDEKFARLVWARILKGNAEGQTLPPNIAGFVGTKEIGPHGQEYVRPENLLYVEAGQLTYTLTRPDVYNAIMAIPGYSMELERELGVDKSAGMDSYDYILTYEAITVDSRFLWRAKSRDGYYWKTFDIFTQGTADIDDAYEKGDVTAYPMWANPIRVRLEPRRNDARGLSYVATLPLGKFSFDVKGAVGRYTAKTGRSSRPRKSSSACRTGCRATSSSAPGISAASTRFT